MERSKQCVNDFKHISQLCSSVSIPAFEQVNTSWVLRASFTDESKAFFHLLKQMRILKPSHI